MRWAMPWAMLATFAALAGCAADDPMATPVGPTSSTTPPGPAADPAPVAPGPEPAAAEASAPIPFLPAWFDCRMLVGKFPVAAQDLQARLPEGYSPASTAGVGLLTILFGSCAAHSLDNQSYSAGGAFALAFTNVQAPPAVRHEGGLDAYVFAFLADNARLLEDAAELGLPAAPCPLALQAEQTFDRWACEGTEGLLVREAAAPPASNTTTTERFFLHWVPGPSEPPRLRVAFLSCLDGDAGASSLEESGATGVSGALGPGIAYERLGSLDLAEVS